MSGSTRPTQVAALRLRLESIESAAVSGLVSAGLLVVGYLLLADQPRASDSSETIAAFYSDPANRLSVITGFALVTFAVIAFLWFIAVVRRRVGGREDRYFATVFLASGIMQATILIVGAATSASAAVSVESLQGPVPERGVLSMFEGLASGLLLIVLPRFQAIFILTTSTIGLRTGAFPRWLSLVGFASALAMLFLPFLIGPIALIFPFWLGLVSIVMLSHRKHPEAVEAEAG